MLTISSRAFRAGEGTSIEGPFPAPKPAKPTVVKPFGFFDLAQESSPPNPLSLSHLISEAYARKRPAFEREDGSSCCSSRKSNDFECGEAPAKASKPIEVKSFRFLGIAHKTLPPKPLKLSRLNSETYVSKMAVFSEQTNRMPRYWLAKATTGSKRTRFCQVAGSRRNFGRACPSSTSFLQTRESNVTVGSVAR